MTIVHMEGVTKVFRGGGEETHALRGINLDIHQGTYVSIIGPSGCGKSTLLSIIGLMDTPTEGVFDFDGKSTKNLSPADRARFRSHDIGFVFQSFNLIGDLSIFENVEQPLTYQKMKRSERKERVTEALQRVGMLDQARRQPSQLSGGEQQRVAVARAFVSRPRILLADEPTGNLDSASGEAIMDILRSLHSGGTTILMVTHDPRFVQMADRLVNMLDGVLVDEKSDEAHF